MKEGADSEFQTALERLFQRVGAECEKAHGPYILTLFCLLGHTCGS